MDRSKILLLFPQRSRKTESLKDTTARVPLTRPRHLWGRIPPREGEAKMIEMRMNDVEVPAIPHRLLHQRVVKGDPLI